MGSRILVLGSTCVDLILNIDHMPVIEENIKPTAQTMGLGGCAFNVADVLRRTGADFSFVTPVGSGLFGDYVEKLLSERGFPIYVKLPEENGCCYCLVEPGGGHSFLAYHGAEYTFKKEWMDPFDAEDYGMVYVCGIEIAECGGEDMVSWLEENPGPQVVFAPAPHIGSIDPGLVERLISLHPILHLNRTESAVMSGYDDIYDAAYALRRRTGNAVIITLGSEGALCLEPEGEPYIIPAEKAEVVDTIGAGDAHCGALMSALQRGLAMRDAVVYANKIAAGVVSVRGASLPE